MEYNGINSNTVGNILLQRKVHIRIFLPANWYLENAYAARVDAVKDTKVVIAATIKLFLIAARKLTVVVKSFL
jgi:hypothetical protein